MKDKSKIWKSSDEWSFETKDTIVCIKNTAKTTVLGSTKDGKVVEENYIEDKPEQMWKKGVPNKRGYFKLMNCESGKFLTAMSSNDRKWLEIIGT